MHVGVVTIEELTEMLLIDVDRGIEVWTHKDIWEMAGGEPSQYPKSGTVAYIKWREKRSHIFAAINKCLERKKKAIRLRVSWGSCSQKENGDFIQNKWCVVPKEEALNWNTLEAAKKILAPLATSVERTLGYSTAEGFPPETKMMFINLAAMLDSVGSVVLKNSQSIDGLDKATISELQEWDRRKQKKYQKLLKA